MLVVWDVAHLWLYENKPLSVCTHHNIPGSLSEMINMTRAGFLSREHIKDINVPRVNSLEIDG